MIHRLLLVLIAFIYAVSCAPTNPSADRGKTQKTEQNNPTDTQTATARLVSATDAFIMEPVGSRTLTMGGMRIQAGKQNIRLIGASAPEIGAIELHTVTLEGRMMKMRQVNSFAIAAGETLVLQKGDDHLMMFDVGDRLIAGQRITITLLFNTDGDEQFELAVPAEVRTVRTP